MKRKERYSPKQLYTQEFKGENRKMNKIKKYIYLEVDFIPRVKYSHPNSSS